VIDPAQKQLWLRELRLNGFVVLRDFLPADLVRSMLEELTPLLDSEHAKARTDEFARGRAPGRLALHIAQYADLFRGALADERYRRNPAVEELVDAVMGPGEWDRGWTVVEAVWPGAHYMTWHSDQKPEDTPDMEAPGSGRRMAFNIPLVDFTWSSGAMELLPGSHHLPRSFGGVADLPRIYPVRLELRVGDAVLRDCNCLHRGTPNLTDRVRPMLDQTYKKRFTRHEATAGAADPAP